MSEQPVLGIIGGTGLTNFSGLKNAEIIDLETPYGKPSSPIFLGTLGGKRIAFLARHGIGHSISPSEVNNRANIYALKSVGVRRILGISACGSLREDFVPGHLVIPDQVFDFTRDRARTYFGDGMVAHIGTADPFCPDLAAMTQQAVLDSGAAVHKGGTLITVEGPRFSTKTKSNLFRLWGMSVIGMTTCPEVFLAREAQVCYVSIAHVTDYDVWHAEEAPVNVEMITQVLQKNVGLIQESIRVLLERLPEERLCSCKNILDKAIVTDLARIPAVTSNSLTWLLN